MLIPHEVRGMRSLPSCTVSSTNTNLVCGMWTVASRRSWAGGGVRGVIRYCHAFEDLNALGFTLSDTRLDFGRASVALMPTF